MPAEQPKETSLRPLGLLSAEQAKQIDDAVHEQIARASLGLSPMAMALAAADWAMHLASSPGRQMLLAQKAAQLLADEFTALAAPASDAAVGSDNRFADPAWQEFPFRLLKERFKTSEAWWREVVEVDGMSSHRRQMMSFFVQQWLDALSPSNWPLSNPEVWKQGAETGGRSLLDGWKLLLRDLGELAQAGRPADGAALPPLRYEVGRQVGITPGKVVWRNQLIELIQYEPTTAKVQAEPLLIVPSPIMKFYILDLQPHNSMVRYLVAQGFTVFMVSWRNPDANDRELGVDDYLELGVMDALRQSARLSASPQVHAMGYCLGGTFLAIAAAQLCARDCKPARKARPGDAPSLASVTLLAAQTDFSEAGELGTFIDDDQLKALRAQVARQGYLSGRQMAAAFQLLHAKDLVWARNTQRYLLGAEEEGNDLMSWNADTTRLPARMHSEYLDSLFLNNALADGHYRVQGMPVAMMNLKRPLMVVGTARDHVSPWRSVYKIHLLTDTDTSFILASGGHNAGIVSEPGHANRSYQVGRVAAGHGWTDPDDWQKSAERREGSWWEAWAGWLREHSSAEAPARAIDAAAALCDAPGEYVMVRYAD